MSQEKVLLWLQKRRGERFTAARIKYLMGLGVSVYANLRKLRGSGLVEYSVVVGGKGAEKSFVYWTKK